MPALSDDALVRLLLSKTITHLSLSAINHEFLWGMPAYMCEDRVFEAVNSNSHLSSLKMEGCYFISEKQWQMLARNTTLCQLSLSVYEVNSGLATFLQSSSSLTRLTLTFAGDKQTFRTPLTLSPKLTYLELYHCYPTVALEICRACEHLKTFDLIILNGSAEEIDELLEWISIIGVELECLNVVVGNEWYKQRSLENDMLFQSLGELPSLTNLRLAGMINLPPDWSSLLSHSCSIQSLVLNVDEVLTEKAVVSEVTSLSSIASLHQLHIYHENVKMNDDVAIAVASIHNLTDLRLEWCCTFTVRALARSLH